MLKPPRRARRVRAFGKSTEGNWELGIDEVGMGEGGGGVGKVEWWSMIID